MPLSAFEIAELSRLLDAALALAPDAREAWLAGLPEPSQPLARRLRRLLAASSSPGAQAPYSTLPRLADDRPAARAGERVGAYRLLRELGQGGMGEVWRAERADGIFERQVAVKLPRVSHSARLAERMAQERRIGALLEHPHIARLYDAGIDDAGRPYIVMELVEGTGLLEHAERLGLTVEERLRLFLQACAAVEHAHRQLVVHRDIKPSNLMVDAAGQVRLLDFGIALLLESPSDPGAPAGAGGAQAHTPRYAAPELRAGRPATTVADLYSLGLVLHELLTGRAPPEAGPPDLAPRLASDPLLDDDLRAVLACALHPDPAARYSSVERLADDLRALLAHRPVRARPGSAAHRLRLFGRRHRALLGLGAFTLCLALAAGAAVLAQRERAADEARRAAQTREFLSDMLEDAEPAAGQSMAEISGLQMVQGALARARSSFADQPVLRGQILSELGVVLRQLDQPGQALLVLREAHALLETHAAADDPALHIAAAQLAVQLQSDGGPADEAEALTLAGRARAGCAAPPPRCAKARAFARDVQLTRASAAGAHAEALRLARLSVADYRQAFGDGDPQLVSALVRLAVIARNQGALAEAGAAVDEAQAIAARRPLRAGDAHDLQLNAALIDHDLGRYDAAQHALQRLVARLPPAAASGPDAALPRRLQAQVALAQGLFDDALHAADAALAAGPPAAPEGQTPRTRLEAAYARQARARALAGLGRHDDARQEIAAVLAALRALGLPEAGIEILRARRHAGEIALRAGDVEGAVALLSPLPAAHAQAPDGNAPAPVTAGDARTPPRAGTPRFPVDLAQAMDLLGTAARRQGDAATALRWHREAAELLRPALPDAHPLRTRNALLTAIAAWLGGGARDPAPLRAAAQAYSTPWPAGSAWHRLPEPQAEFSADWQNLVL